MTMFIHRIKELSRYNAGD